MFLKLKLVLLDAHSSKCGIYFLSSINHAGNAQVPPASLTQHIHDGTAWFSTTFIKIPSHLCWPSSSGHSTMPPLVRWMRWMRWVEHSKDQSEYGGADEAQQA